MQMANQNPFKWRKPALIHLHWPSPALLQTQKKTIQTLPQSAGAKMCPCEGLGCLCRNDIVQV